MPEIRYYLDENVAGSIAKALRRRGIDVLTVPEAGMRGKDDPHQLDLAHRIGRVLVTHDVDYLAIAAQGHPHGGIVFAGQGMAIGELIRSLELIHHVLTSEEMKGTN